MAPIARASQAGGGVGKKVHRKRVPRKEPSDSWELLYHQGMNPGADENVMDTQEQGDELEMSSPVDVAEAVGPLREMAERVGKEVETFAETLDGFLTDLPTMPSRFEAAHDLVLAFKEIAMETVARMKDRYDRELRAMLKREWSEQAPIPAASTALQPFASTRSSISAKMVEQVNELRKWQQEVDIWDLFRIMLELHPFEADAQALRAEKEEKLATLGQPHRYTSEAELWERFILEDDLAKERLFIKEWLERTAENQSSDLHGIVEELETKAGRGKGLWSSGWMHTRETIKQEKRTHTWPTSLDTPLPILKASGNNELLVTTLDPDAASRQQRTLQKPDSYFERAMWIACWEMLRRGMPLPDICEWCEQRKEGWRAVCIGCAVDFTDSTASTAAWRRICRKASQSSSASEYEAAVFGLLGGNVKAVQKVCRTVDDHLYAYYSSALMQQFDNYVLATCPDKGTPQHWHRSVLGESIQDPQQAEQAISELIHRLRQSSNTKNESTQPMKIIQSYLLADEVGSLIHTVGAAMGETAALRGPEDMIFLRDREARTDGVTLPEAEVGLDPQTLRIAAHMSIVHRILSPDYLAGVEGDELLEDENVLVAYIQALRAAGKRDLIPMYASKLQRERYVIVMGRVLQDILDESEQRRILNLLRQYDLDLPAILAEQLKWVLEHSLGGGEYPHRPIKILENTSETKLHPGQKIRVGFLRDEASPEDEAVVRCLDWILLMPGRWPMMFDALSTALIRALSLGRITCARLIVNTFPYEAVSHRKAFDTLGRAVNLMDTTSFAPHDEREAMIWNIMRRQSTTYFELSAVVEAIEALSEWRTEEDKYVNKSQKPSTVPGGLKEAKKRVSAAMDPILQGILLNPSDEQEAVDLERIRLGYLPEIVIAYNTVLHAAGNLITRDHLLESMQLSVAVGMGKAPHEREMNKGENGLEECFVRASRMRELVTSFALTSKIMLVLKAEGKPWKPKKDREGKELGIWEIGGGVRAGEEEG